MGAIRGSDEEWQLSQLVQITVQRNRFDLLGMWQGLDTDDTDELPEIPVPWESPQNNELHVK